MLPVLATSMRLLPQWRAPLEGGATNPQPPVYKTGCRASMKGTSRRRCDRSGAALDRQPATGLNEGHLSKEVRLRRQFPDARLTSAPQ